MNLMNLVSGKRGRTIRDEGRSCWRMGCWGKRLALRITGEWTQLLRSIIICTLTRLYWWNQWGWDGRVTHAYERREIVFCRDHLERHSV